MDARGPGAFRLHALGSGDHDDTFSFEVSAATVAANPEANPRITSSDSRKLSHKRKTTARRHPESGSQCCGSPSRRFIYHQRVAGMAASCTRRFSCAPCLRVKNLQKKCASRAPMPQSARSHADGPGTTSVANPASSTASTKRCPDQKSRHPPHLDTAARCLTSRVV